MTKQQIRKYLAMEEDAVTTCGAFLGSCYIMCEMIEWLMRGSYYEKHIQAAPWYRHTVKQDIKDARKELHKIIENSKSNSRSDNDYMMRLADEYYDSFLKDEFFKLNNAVRLELKPSLFNKPVDTKPLADLVTVLIILDWISDYYEKVLTFMRERVPNVNYETHYKNAKAESVYKLWQRATDRVFGEFITDTIDFGKMPSIQIARASLNNKMNDEVLANDIATRVDRSNMLANAVVVDKAMTNLGIINS